MKRILIILFSICALNASAQKFFDNGNHQGGGNNGKGVGNSLTTSDEYSDPADTFDDPDADPSTQVPLDDYVPFLVAGVVVYGLAVNRKKKAVLR